ncbi:MAG: RNA polymerase factor sigma-54 [Victivallales bacterium]|nr:RNA polymerase factor sigma-54 [Victivallales bacterium]
MQQNLNLSTSQNQELKQTQTLNVSQLQSLNLLQTTNLELQQKVAEELQVNPVLELVSNGPEIDYGDFSASNSSHEDNQNKAAELAEKDESIAELASYDMSSDAEFDMDLAPSDKSRSSSSSEDAREYFLSSLTKPQNSYDDFSTAVMEFAGQDQKLKQLAQAILDRTDPKTGYLSATDGELAIITELTEEKVHDFVTLLQKKIEPPGMLARDLRECLLIQLERNFEKYELSWKIVDQCLDDLLNNRIPAIASKLECSVQDVNNALPNIRALTPTPGRFYDDETAPVVVPEATIMKINGQWTVIMNRDAIPCLEVNTYYQDLYKNLHTKDDKETKGYLKEQITRANDLINAIGQRESTIKQVTICILRHQLDFFENGPEQLRPMTQADIATQLGYNESTISRAIANKYLTTPYGLYPYSFFFSTGYRSSDGEDVAAGAIKQKLAALIESEPPNKPYSDQKLADMLAEQGLNVARRTVAKYREAMNILPASNRKVFN